MRGAFSRLLPNAFEDARTDHEEAGPFSYKVCVKGTVLRTVTSQRRAGPPRGVEVRRARVLAYDYRTLARVDCAAPYPRRVSCPAICSAVPPRCRGHRSPRDFANLRARLAGSLLELAKSDRPA